MHFQPYSNFQDTVANPIVEPVTRITDVKSNQLLTLVISFDQVPVFDPAGTDPILIGLYRDLSNFPLQLDETNANLKARLFGSLVADPETSSNLSYECSHYQASPSSTLPTIFQGGVYISHPSDIISSLSGTPINNAAHVFTISILKVQSGMKFVCHVPITPRDNAISSSFSVYPALIPSADWSVISPITLNGVQGLLQLPSVSSYISTESLSALSGYNSAPNMIKISFLLQQQVPGIVYFKVESTNPFGLPQFILDYYFSPTTETMQCTTQNNPLNNNARVRAFQTAGGNIISVVVYNPTTALITCPFYILNPRPGMTSMSVSTSTKVATQPADLKLSILYPQNPGPFITNLQQSIQIPLDLQINADNQLGRGRIFKIQAGSGQFILTIADLRQQTTTLQTIVPTPVDSAVCSITSLSSESYSSTYTVIVANPFVVFCQFSLYDLQSPIPIPLVVNTDLLVTVNAPNALNTFHHIRPTIMLSSQFTNPQIKQFSDAMTEVSFRIQWLQDHLKSNFNIVVGNFRGLSNQYEYVPGNSTRCDFYGHYIAGSPVSIWLKTQTIHHAIFLTFSNYSDQLPSLDGLDYLEVLCYINHPILPLEQQLVTNGLQFDVLALPDFTPAYNIRSTQGIGKRFIIPGTQQSASPVYSIQVALNYEPANSNPSDYRQFVNIALPELILQACKAIITTGSFSTQNVDCSTINTKPFTLLTSSPNNLSDSWTLPKSYDLLVDSSIGQNSAARQTLFDPFHGSDRLVMVNYYTIPNSTSGDESFYKSIVSQLNQYIVDRFGPFFQAFITLNNEFLSTTSPPQPNPGYPMGVLTTDKLFPNEPCLYDSQCLTEFCSNSRCATQLPSFSDDYTITNSTYFPENPYGGTMVFTDIRDQWTPGSPGFALYLCARAPSKFCYLIWNGLPSIPVSRTCEATPTPYCCSFFERIATTTTKCISTLYPACAANPTQDCCHYVNNFGVAKACVAANILLSNDGSINQRLCQAILPWLPDTMVNLSGKTISYADYCRPLYFSTATVNLQNLSISQIQDSEIEPSILASDTILYFIAGSLFKLTWQVPIVRFPNVSHRLLITYTPPSGNSTTRFVGEYTSDLNLGYSTYQLPQTISAGKISSFILIFTDPSTFIDTTITFPTITAALIVLPFCKVPVYTDASSLTPTSFKNTCNFGATCDEETNRCLCNDVIPNYGTVFSGDSCMLDCSTKTTTSLGCLNEGFCNISPSPDTNVCTCSKGSSGGFCQTIDDCKEQQGKSCQNDGYLTQSTNLLCSTSCTCPSPFIGTDCSICGIQCKNSGYTTKKCTCNCPALYLGAQCECRLVKFTISISSIPTFLKTRYGSTVMSLTDVDILELFQYALAQALQTSQTVISKSDIVITQVDVNVDSITNDHFISFQGTISDNCKISGNNFLDLVDKWKTFSTDVHTITVNNEPFPITGVTTEYPDTFCDEVLNPQNDAEPQCKKNTEDPNSSSLVSFAFFYLFLLSSHFFL